MFQYKILSLYIVVLFFLVSPTALYAEGELSIEPGKYKITKTTKTNFDSDAVTRTSEECITNPDLNPQSILPDKDNCVIKNMKTSQNKTSFEFICDEPGTTSKLKGQAEYGTAGNSISSKIKLEGTFKGKELIVESSGSGERIGECIPEPKL